MRSDKDTESIMMYRYRSYYENECSQREGAILKSKEAHINMIIYLR